MECRNSEPRFEELVVQANYRPGRLAALCNVSLRTLQRHFSSRYGMSLGVWLRNFRMQQAYERITGGDTIKVVAYDLGFKQLSHFSRCFKEVHGFPPRFVSRNGHAQLKVLLPAGEATQARGQVPDLVIVHS